MPSKIRSNCWNCNAEGRFAERSRPVAEGSDVLEIYIHCDMCRQDKRLFLSTASIQSKRRKRIRIIKTGYKGLASDKVFHKLGDEIITEATSMGLSTELLLN